MSRRERLFLLSTRTLLALCGLCFGRLLVRRGLDRFWFAQPHLDLHHLEFPLGVEALYVDLGRRNLALGLAGTELADSLGLVGGLADRLPSLLQVAGGVGEGDVGAGLVGRPEGTGALVLLHQRGAFAHHVVVAAFLVAEGLLQLLGVLAGFFETRLDVREARLGLLFLLDNLDGGLPLAPARKLAGLAFLDGQGLLLGDGVVGEHLLVGHGAGRRDLQLLQVLEFVLYGVLEQYLGIALLDPGEKPPEETADSPCKSSHLRRHPRQSLRLQITSWIISSVRETPLEVSAGACCTEATRYVSLWRTPAGEDYGAG